MGEQARRILLAEDDRFLRKAAEATLRRHGFDVLTAQDGEEALRLARDEAPDLVLLDMIMPELQGFEVLRRLKQDPATRPIPVIVLSNLGQESDVKQALEAGAVAYLIKASLTLEELVKRVEEALKRVSTDSMRADQRGRTSGRTMPRILMAGLPAELARWLQLQLSGASVQATHNGKETLDALAREDWSLLVIDGSIADLPASEVLTRTRARLGLGKLPVVFCVEQGASGDLLRRLVSQFGVDRLLFHPLNREELARQVAETLGLPLPPVETGEWGTQHEGMETLGRMWEEFKEATLSQVALFERAATAWLEGALDDELRRTVRREAHRLAGSMGMLGFPDGSRLAKEIENMLQAGAPPGQGQARRLSGLVAALRRELEKTPSWQPPLHVPGDERARLWGAPKDMELAERLVEESPAVMAVDDDPQVLAAIRSLLRPPRFSLTTLDDPLGFWEALEEVSPDLLILDVDMPYVSGVELCRVVRNDPRWIRLPVLFLTGHTDSDTVHRVFAVGADDYVSKPIVGPELLTRIVNRLERTQLHRRMADTDPLTGVANRRKFSEVLSRFLRMADRFSQPLSLALLDLDHFKQINDLHGHAVGDAVLRRLGEILLRSFRSEDVVARWGGEEFVVGMYGVARADGVSRLASVLETLRQEEFSGPDHSRFRVTFSAGVAQYPEDGADLPDLSRAADGALYQAKVAGRNRVLPVGWSAGQR